NTLPLSFAQQRLWFLHQVLPAKAAALYNGPLPIRLQGNLDVDAFAVALNEVIRRHEVLRTAFRMIGDEPTQIILPELSLAIERVDLSGWSEEDRIEEPDRLAAADACHPFDLAHPPLLRAKLVALGEDDHVLLLNIHHIVFDGWSAVVLLSELSA